MFEKLELLKSDAIHTRLTRNSTWLPMAILSKKRTDLHQESGFQECHWFYLEQPRESKRGLYASKKWGLQRYNQPATDNATRWRTLYHRFCSSLPARPLGDNGASPTCSGSVCHFAINAEVFLQYSL